MRQVVDRGNNPIGWGNDPDPPGDEEEEGEEHGEVGEMAPGVVGIVVVGVVDVGMDGAAGLVAVTLSASLSPLILLLTLEGSAT